VVHTIVLKRIYFIHAVPACECDFVTDRCLLLSPDLSQSDSAANPQTESQQLDEDAAAEHFESRVGSQALSEPGPWEMEEVTDEELFEKTESAANPQTESQQLDEDAAEHFGQADESQAGSQALSEPGPWEMEEVTDTESCSTRPRRGSAFLMPLA